jgi:hypothetical protein
MTQEQQNFIDKVKDGAIHTMQKYGVMASMTIAQSILESGWGKTALAQNANNLFGIKRHGSENYVSMPTREYNPDGSSYMITADFRAYDSWEDSILDHGKFLTDNKRYSNLIGITDYKQSCVLIRQDGYATDPEYGQLLIGIIERYNLNQYDVIEKTNKGFVKEVKGMINYMAYIEGEGWQEMKRDGEVAGTIGQGKRVEALLAIYNGPGQLDITAHVQNIGYQAVRHSGEVIGTIGLGLRMEGITAYIPGKNIACQVHVEGIGWMDPAYNGDLAGTEGRGLRIEAVKFIVED